MAVILNILCKLIKDHSLFRKSANYPLKVSETDIYHLCEANKKMNTPLKIIPHVLIS